MGFAACVDAYDLHAEVSRRLARFLEKEDHRSKTQVPSLGDFIPLLSVCKENEFSWDVMAKPLLEESFDRNVLWVCKAHPAFALPKHNVLGEGADEERLQNTLEAKKISQRLYMFHVLFLDLVEQQN